MKYGYALNNWGQYDNINKIIIFIKRGLDRINDVILTKYHKYLSTTILEHVNFLAKVNKSPEEHLHNITPHDDYSIIIHVSTVNVAYISHEQKK